MIERVTIEAREVRAGDRFAKNPRVTVASTASVYVTAVHGGASCEVPGIEIWTNRSADPMGMPCLTVEEYRPVTVWREVSR